MSAAFALKSARAVGVRVAIDGDDLALEAPEHPPQAVLDLLAGFRDSAVRQILDRLTRLHRRAAFDELAVSGGAAANRELRRRLVDWAAERGVTLRLVPLVYSGDNAAMIAFAALQRLARGESDDPLAVDVASRLPIAPRPFERGRPPA